MRAKLLDFIGCPVCGRGFDLTSCTVQGDHIMEGTLDCPRGHGSFAIVGGVPRFVDGLADDHQQVHKAFEAKWAVNPDQYLLDETNSRFSSEFYFQRYNWYDPGEYDRMIAAKRMILDVGSGSGRILATHLTQSRGQVIALELTNSVDVLFKRHSSLDNVHIIQADIMRMPFPADLKFDYIIANAVLHHTRDTRQALHLVSSHLAPDGVMDAYIYARKALIRELVDDHLLPVTSTGMSEEQCWEFCQSITDLGRELSKYTEPLVIEKDIPVLGIKAGEHNLQRLIFYNFLKCFWNSDVGREYSLMTNFDWYRPQYSHRHTVEQIKQWSLELGLNLRELNSVPSGHAFQLTPK